MLPIALRADGRRAVIVGGGNVAVRKADSLVAAGFPVFVVAPSIDERLRALLDGAAMAYAERAYARNDLENAALAIAATDDDAVNAQVVEDALSMHLLVCDAMRPERGNFTMTATVRIGDLTVSVDSAGSSPAFSRRIIREVSQTFGPEYGEAGRTLAQLRGSLRESLDEESRSDVMRELAERPIDELASMQLMQLVCASRASALAMKQTRGVAARLAQRGIATTILEVTTTGDRKQDRPIDQLDSVNVFVKELETALRERRADYAVHSCKDLPSELPSGFAIAAIAKREDPRDAFCSERYSSFDALPSGATVGTSSPRRRLQLAALRPDLKYDDLRGNVDTRLRKLRDGNYDAIVLAMAGLNRLRAGARYVVPFTVDQLVPAVGQGALAIETLADEAALIESLHAALNDAPSELCVRCERAALRALRAGCSAPIGIHAELHDDRMTVYGAYVVSPGDVRRKQLETRISGPSDAEALGVQLAQRLAPLEALP
jgi:hydroxymethylbilane synthase